jgi:probable F420-dependent oxidoreductase
MSKVDVGPVGIALNISADETYLHEAAEAERLGYSTIWLPGGQIDNLDRIAKIVRATTTISVASAIISADVYTPDAVMRLYADLQATAPDRFVVGLGGPQKPRSLAALNDYLDQLDQGDTPVPAHRRVLAALGPRKLELARDRCAGAVTLLVTPAYTRKARHILGGDATLVVDQMLVLDTDASHARDTARGPLRFLSGVGGYLANFERMGFSATDISELSDQLVDELVVWGDADAIAVRVRAHLDAGADHVVLGVLNERSQPGPIQVARQLAGELLR